LHQAPGSGASIDPTSGLDIDAQQVDHLLIVKAFVDDLDLVETVNRLAPSQMAVKPGLMVLGLVLDTLTGRSPLYRLVDFYEGRDTELLLGERVPRIHLSHPIVTSHDGLACYIEYPVQRERLEKGLELC
jgi:hypothetical protein